MHMCPTAATTAGLLPSALEQYPALGRFFEVLSHSRDRAGTRYVSTLEAREHPFTGIAYHPEKVGQASVICDL